LNSFLEKYHKQILLNLFVITLIGGSFMLEFHFFGVDLYAFRILLIASLVYLFFTGRLKLFHNKASRYTFFFMVIWLIYAALSIFWCIDKMAAYRDIMYLLFGIATLIFMVSIKHGFRDFETELVTVWMQAFFVVLAVSVWEINTANHLVSNFTHRLHELKPFHNLNFVPVFTFDNPNHFAIFLCLTIALFVGLILKNSKVALLTFLTSCSCFLLHILSARLGYIVMFIYVIMLLLFYFYKNRGLHLQSMKQTFFKVIFIFVFLMAGIFATHKVENVYEEKILETVIEPDDRLPSSVLRKNLIMNGYDFFIESKGMGVGAGNYMSYTQQGKGKHETDGIDSPHCWVVEVLTQYGIVIGVLFFLCFMYFIKVLISSARKTGFQREHLILTLLISCYIFMSNSNSIFMPLPLNWTILSLIVVFTDDLLETNSPENA
jgi:teichuronic acid biosynthesis protein TuaE